MLRALTLAVMAMSFSLLSCHPTSEEWESEVRKWDVHTQTDLVVLLKPGLTPREIDRFLQETLYVGPADGSHWHRPGVAGLFRCYDDGRQVGFGVFLDPRAAPDLAAGIRGDVKASRFVDEVFENVAPEDVVPTHS